MSPILFHDHLPMAAGGRPTCCRTSHASGELQHKSDHPLVPVGPGLDIVLRSNEPSTVTHGASRLSGTSCEWRQTLLRELLCRTCGLDGTVVVLVRVRNVAHGQVLSSRKMKLRLARLSYLTFVSFRTLSRMSGSF